MAPDALASIADELAISRRQLDELSLDRVCELVQEPDLDPTAKCQLVRAQIAKLRSVLELADIALVAAVQQRGDRNG